MAKTKSSREAVRNTPQPKMHRYVPAVFRDDYGRDRTLTVESAKQFSKKKLSAAAIALQRRGDRGMDMAIAAGDRETARAIRRLRKQERASDFAMKRYFRRYMKTKVPITNKIKHGQPKPQKPISPSKWKALPSYDGPVRDRQRRRGVFLRVRYYSGRSAKPGVSMRVTKYFYRGSALGSDGVPMFTTNVGDTIEEAVAGFDHLEQVNWSAQRGAKIGNQAIVAMDYRWTPEQMLAVGTDWAEECFGQHDLPYMVCLHEPPPDGDERNWHLHVFWSWRPLERIGDHEWLVSESLRTDLDGEAGMRVLRENLAVAMTEMSQEAGRPELYTALSYGARGLPIEPQIHLGEARTRQARASEFVRDNEENHERGLRSRAAMIEDDLRREDTRLAHQLSAIKRVRDRFTAVPNIPVVPAAAFNTQYAFSLPEKRNALKVRTSLSRPTLAKIPEAVPKAPHSLEWLENWIKKRRKAAREFANLRILQASSFAQSLELPLRQSLVSQLPNLAAPRKTIWRTVAAREVLKAPKAAPIVARFQMSGKRLELDLRSLPPSLPTPPQPRRDIRQIANMQKRPILRLSKIRDLPPSPRVARKAQTEAVSRPLKIRQQLQPSVLPSPILAPPAAIPVPVMLGRRGKAPHPAKAPHPIAISIVELSQMATASPQQSASISFPSVRQTSKPLHPSLIREGTIARIDRVLARVEKVLNAAKSPSRLVEPLGEPGTANGSPRPDKLGSSRGDTAVAAKDNHGMPASITYAEECYAANSQLPLDYRIKKLAFDLHRANQQIAYGHDRIVRPAVAQYKTWGLSDEELASPECQAALQPLLVLQELKFEQLERELLPHFLADPQVSKNDDETLKSAVVSDHAKRTADEYRRTALYAEMLKRLREAALTGKPLKSRAQVLKDNGFDLVKLLNELPRQAPSLALNPARLSWDEQQGR